MVRVDPLTRRPNSDPDDRTATEEMREIVRAWPVPEAHPATHTAIIVVVRNGLCVVGPDEGSWLGAWRYTNHLKRLFSAELVLITEHGWVDYYSSLAGQAPALPMAA